MATFLPKAPNGVAVRHIQTVLKQTKPLVAHAIKQLVLHLLIAEVVELFENQYPNHHIHWIGWSACIVAIASPQEWHHQRGQRIEVDVIGYDLQGIAHFWAPVLTH